VVGQRQGTESSKQASHVPSPTLCPLSSDEVSLSQTTWTKQCMSHHTVSSACTHGASRLSTSLQMSCTRACSLSLLGRADIEIKKSLGDYAILALSYDLKARSQQTNTHTLGTEETVAMNLLSSMNQVKHVSSRTSCPISAYRNHPLSQVRSVKKLRRYSDLIWGYPIFGRSSAHVYIYGARYHLKKT
jgi:hypothetical protein